MFVVKLDYNDFYLEDKQLDIGDEYLKKQKQIIIHLSQIPEHVW